MPESSSDSKLNKKKIILYLTPTWIISSSAKLTILCSQVPDSALVIVQYPLQ